MEHYQSVQTVGKDYQHIGLAKQNFEYFLTH